MKQQSFWVLAGLTVALLASGAAKAQAPVGMTPMSGANNAGLGPADTTLFNPRAVAPDVSAIPVLSSLTQQGAKLFYLGERSGMPGWFIWLNGQVQMIYLSPDRQTAFIGGMFSNQGANVTGEQIKYLNESNKEFVDLVNQVTAQQNAAGAVPGVTPAVAPVAPLLSNNLPAVALTPGERLYQELSAAGSVVVGANPKAEILMVMDTNCPFCQATWKELRDKVRANQLQVRLIPITNLDPTGEDTRTGAKLLESANPLDAWDQYVSGNKAALAGASLPDKNRAVLANRELADKWKIKATPYLVYRGKDGKVKLVSGKPDDIKAVLRDLGV